jgi:hypothetical protein
MMRSYREDKPSVGSGAWWQSLGERKRDYLSAIPFIALFFALTPILGQGRAFAVGAVVLAFSVIISRCWHRRRDARLWIVLAVFAIIHIAAFSMISFPEQIRPGLIALPFALADGLAMYWFLEWLEKRFPTRRG